jgi:hypothetical protein
MGPTIAPEVRRREGRRRCRPPELGRVDSRVRRVQPGRHPDDLGSATNPKLTEQGFKVVFRTVGRDDQQGPAVAAYVANELRRRRSRSR